MSGQYGLRRVVAALMLVAVSAIGVAACGSSSDSSTSSTSAGASGKPANPLRTIAYASISDANPQYRGIGDKLQKLAAVDGVKVTRFDNKFDATAALQNARVMVQQKPDVFLDWSATADANVAIGKQFQQAGKPCVAINIKIPGCPWFNLDNHGLGADEGPIAAKQATARGWSGADTTLVLVNAPFAGPEINALISGFYATFAKDFPGMKQVPESDIKLTTTKIGDNTVIVDGKATLADSNKIMRQTLLTIPSNRHLVVVTLNDDSALGVQRALAQARRDKNALIVANAASKPGLDELRKNKSWVADGSVFVEYWADYVYAMAKALHAGASPPERTAAPQLVITRENIDQYYNADESVKSAPAIAPSAAYLKQYGLTP
jgi:ribose transport system substrate-binding protein